MTPIRPTAETTGPQMRRRIGAVSRNPLVQRLAHGAFWSVISSGVGQGGSLLASMATARLLGSVQFGKLAVILSTINLFATVGAAGLGVTATKHVAEYRQSDPGRAGRVIGLASATAVSSGLVAALFLLVLAPWLARDVLLVPALVKELRLSALILFLTSFNGYQIGALAGFEAFRGTAAANLIRGLSGLPIQLAGAILGGLPGAVLAYGIVTLVSCIAHSYMLRRQCTRSGIRISYALRSEDFGLLFTFSLPVVLSGAAYALAGWLGNAALARNSGFRENGLFQIGVHWLTLGLFLSGAVGNVGLPMLTSNLDSRKRYLQTLAANGVLMICLNLLIALPAIALAPWIVRIYGAQYTGAVVVLRVMCGVSLLLAANNSINQIIWSLGRAMEGLVFSVIRSGLLVATAFYFAKHGAIGLAWANFVTSLAMNIIQIPFVTLSIRRLVVTPDSSGPVAPSLEVGANA